MKLSTILAALTILCSYSAPAQELLWRKVFGGASDGSTGLATADGGYLIVGTSRYRPDSTVGACGYFVKLDADGNTQWERRFGCSTGTRPGAIFPHDSGRYIIFGEGSRGFESPYSRLSVLIADSSGAIIRESTYGDQIHFGFGNASRTADGGFIITGRTTAQNNDTWLWKINRDGELEWSKLYRPNPEDRGQAVVQLSDGGYMITGMSLSYSSPVSDIMMLRTDANGDSLWLRHIITPYHDEGRAIFQQPDGTLLIAGQAISGNRRVANILRVTAEGEVMTNDTFGLPDHDVMIHTAQRSPGRGFLLTGWTRPSDSVSGAYLAELNDDGALRWQKEYLSDSLSLASTGVVIVSATETLLVGQAWGASTGHSIRMLAMKVGSLSTGVQDYLYRPTRLDLR